MAENSNIPPPNRWIWILEKICPDSLLEGILGDMLEQFEYDAEVLGTRKAKLRFVWNVIRMIHPYILFKNNLVIKLLNMGLIKNHLLVVFRSMMKYKFYSIVNISGLASGLALVFLVTLFVSEELSVDQFHSKKDRIYRLSNHTFDKETRLQTRQSAVTSIPHSAKLKNQVPGIEMNTRFGSSTGIVMNEQQPTSETITFVDNDFLSIFDYPWVAGNQSTALESPVNVVLSEAMAFKYFGFTEALGQTMEIVLNDSSQLYQVTGIINPKKEASSLQFDLLLPIEQYKIVVTDEVYDSEMYGIVENYILVKEDQSLSELQAVIKASEQERNRDQPVDVETHLTPLTAIHIDHELIGNAAFINPQKLWVLTSLSILVMIVATINFITLTTSQSLNRLKEIGLRKTLGAFKNQLRIQFIGESTIVGLMASGLGIGMAFFLLPIFNSLVDSQLSFNWNWQVIGAIFLTVLLVAFVTGFLQGLPLIQSKTNDALHGRMVNSSKGSIINKSLIVIQFSLSIILIICTLIMNDQMNFIQNSSLGFESERLIDISLGYSSQENKNAEVFQRLKQKLDQNPTILSSSASMNSFALRWTQLSFLQQDDSEEKIFYNMITPEYLETMGIDLSKGRNFRPDEGHSTKGILVNEALVRHFGWENPLEEQIPGKNFSTAHQIIGVVKDFHFSSLHNKIEPLILGLSPNAIVTGVTGLTTEVWPPNIYEVLVKVGPGDLTTTMANIEAIWNEIYPGAPFIYQFADESIQRAYQEDHRWRKIANSAALFAICIAWIGLLGVTRLTVQKKTKEIGIRKILGSSSGSIISFLAQPFAKLILIALLIAIPLSWMLMDKWLTSFVYRTGISIWLIGGAALSILLLTILSVAIQGFKTSVSNPVESLKHE